MGKPDQFAKDIFAEETSLVTGGVFSFQSPAELPVFEVHLDGLLLVHDPARLLSLPPPWSLAPASAPVVADLKMQRDHLDLTSVELLLHRRQSWQAAQLRKDNSYSLQPASWVIAGNVPEWSSSAASPWRWEQVAAGCYALQPCWFSLLWVASNELPLDEALIPFLVTRRGRPLVDFCAWALRHRPVAWVWRMLQYVPMTQVQREELLRYFPPTDDPEVLRNREEIARGLVKVFPRLREEMIEEAEKRGIDKGKKLGLDEGARAGKVAEARKAVERVLQRRNLAVSEAQAVQLAACDDLDTLERWHDLAITAATADEVFG
jgi:hypothetical protein